MSALVLRTTNWSLRVKKSPTNDAKTSGSLGIDRMSRAVNEHDMATVQELASSGARTVRRRYLIDRAEKYQDGVWQLGGALFK